MGLRVSDGGTITLMNMEYTYDDRIAYYVEKIIIYK